MRLDAALPLVLTALGWLAAAYLGRRQRREIKHLSRLVLSLRFRIAQQDRCITSLGQTLASSVISLMVTDELLQDQICVLDKPPVVTVDRVADPEDEHSWN